MKRTVLYLLSGLLYLSISIGSLHAQAAPVVNGVTPSSATLGDTLVVTLTGTDLNSLSWCATPANTVRIWGSGFPSPVVGSNVSVNYSTATATMIIPNDVRYVGNNTAYLESDDGNGQGCGFGYAAFNIGYGSSGNLAYISGHVYHDFSGNCTEDGADYAVGGQLFELSPAGYTFSTDNNGDFGFWVPAANYTLVPKNAPLYSSTCPATINLAALAPGDSSHVDVAMNPAPGHDFSVAMSSNLARPGFPHHQYISAKYEGFVPPSSNGTLKVYIDTLLINPVSTPAWNAFVNDTAWYYLNGMNSGAIHSIHIGSTVPTIPTVSLGQTLNSYAEIDPGTGDVSLTNNSFQLQTIIQGSYDPNDKYLLSPDKGGYEGLSYQDSVLRYRIRFQNTGTDTAFNINVIDTMSPHLDLSTFRILGASHNYQFSLDSGVVEWLFPNILLLDSSANEPLSHGWIIYEVSPKPNLPHGTKIDNRAGIYFDFNPPVITNWTKNTICLPFSPTVSLSSTSVCPGDSIQVQSNMNGWDYYWSTGDSNQASFIHSPGNYSFALTDTFGCRSDTVGFTIASGASSTSGFTWVDNSGSVSFTNTSTGTTSSFLWDFGDGTTSTDVNPNHSYSGAGNFTVCLIANSSCGSDTSCQTVNLTCVSPVGNFTSQGNNLTFNFTDATTGTPTMWSWDFGDGNSSSNPNPSHTYAAPGTYTVCLTVSNSCGADQECKNITVSCPAPTSLFNYSPTNYTVAFTDNTLGAPTGWTWDFGDGTTSTQQNPTHTFPANGTYNVCLVTQNACSSDTLCIPLTINCPISSSAFTFNVNDFTASFQDGSTGNPNSWHWDFGDGNTSTSTSPNHTYAQNGTYNVCLITQNTCGSDTACQLVTINCLAPAGNFQSSVSGFSVSFTDQSGQNPTTWNWDFGDGNISTQQNPSHTYAQNGTYNVCLVTQNTCGADTTCNSVAINCLAPTSNFNYSVVSNTVSFTDLSGQNPGTWNWDFGDGNTSTLQNPSHTYAISGTYTACLTSSNDCGSDTSCQTLMVVGMEEEALAGIRLYPNPSAGRVTVELGLVDPGRVSLRMFSVTGAQIPVRPDRSSGGHRLELDLSQLATGVYFLEIAGPEGVAHRKILLER